MSWAQTQTRGAAHSQSQGHPDEGRRQSEERDHKARYQERGRDEGQGPSHGPLHRWVRSHRDAAKAYIISAAYIGSMDRLSARAPHRVYMGATTARASIIPAYIGATVRPAHPPELEQSLIC
ncbi:MAG: hypothetical protein EB127_05990 [Alphaproteobacteria bacterium]|nr:hypothetical protein [Alphaproteobacteria bacterium]